MYIEINDKTIIRQIQKKFNLFYPYLQIRFYHSPPGKHEGLADNDLIYAGKSIGEVKQTHISAAIEITPLSKAADVEREFYERFGLAVQIFIKNKADWEQSTGMNQLTLKELNELGRNATGDLIISEPDSDLSFEN